MDDQNHGSIKSERRAEVKAFVWIFDEGGYGVLEWECPLERATRTITVLEPNTGGRV